jgi:hypothetical protein
MPVIAMAVLRAVEDSTYPFLAAALIVISRPLRASLRGDD